MRGDGGRARRRDVGIAGDVTSSAELNAAVARVESELGGLDVLVCSAGIAGASLRTTDVDDDEWKRVMAVNADGVFYANRAALPGMTSRGYGRIVNLASVAGKEGNPMAAAYSAAKAAVIGMTKSIGKDVADDGRARQLHHALAGRDADARRHLSRSTSTTCSRACRWAASRRAEEAAELIAYLGSDRMTFSTGAAFDLSGGRLTY